jgi:glyoxylase-like metal-dependent hydrolase (beta-lactamase superfamily II)
MTKPTIYAKRLGINFVYLIKGESWMLVDVGPAFTLPRLKKWLASIPLDPQEIKLVVITHAHFDHAGAIAAVKELTGAQIAVHHTEGDMIRTGISSHPTPVTAWGQVGWRMLKPMMKALQYPGVTPDLMIGDEGLDLNQFGIPGRILHTPGHTAGSLSVLLDSGDAFVGCMTHNGPPFRLRPNHPIFADDLVQLWGSWDILLGQGALTIYPGHGKPFPVSEIQQLIPDKYQMGLDDGKE